MSPEAAGGPAGCRTLRRRVPPRLHAPHENALSGWDAVLDIKSRNKSRTYSKPVNCRSSREVRQQLGLKSGDALRYCDTLVDPVDRPGLGSPVTFIVTA